MDSDEEIWLALAELFFLDTEPVEADFARVLKLLRSNGWTREVTEKTLVQLIAPHVGGNLGFLLWPVIGEWSGFDRAWLSARVRRSKELRANRPVWHFLISDWWCRRMLRTLGLDPFLERLTTET